MPGPFIVSYRVLCKGRCRLRLIMEIFDHDNSPHLADAFRIIAQNGLRHAFCAICLEHWFILHYEDCGKAFKNGAEALEYLKKFWPQYHKTKSKPYQELRNRLEVAKVRARVLMNNQETDVSPAKLNPYFSICDLISFFEALKVHE